MTTAPNRRREPGSFGTAEMIIGSSLVAALALGLAVLLAFLIGGSNGTGFSWPILAIGILVVIVLAAVLIAAIRLSGGGSRYDTKAKFMATPKDMAPLREPALRTEADRFGTAEVGLGVPLGTMVCDRKTRLLSGYEFVRISIMGPRAGKTSGVVIREIVEHNGPAIATSNKRDVVDATRGPRSEQGTVYIQDVANIVGEKPSWWWNPLSFVTDVERAERMAAILAASNTPAEARADAYFSQAARDYLSSLILAAAVAGLPMSQVLTWSTEPGELEPADLLKKNDFAAAARTLEGIINLTPKQRDGVVGTAAPWISFLRNPRYLAWIERTSDDDRRPEFDPEAFVGSRADTLYLISKEGTGSARAITAALTMATLDAADRLGARSKGMRMPRPLMASLDEAANIVRWPELPDLYSHYGSRGIILSVFLQSWTQGAEAWGENGIKKMWSAANVKLVGKGVSEVPFLREIQDLIGTRDVMSGSVSRGKGGASRSTSLRRDNIFEVSELQAIPDWRALLFSTGAPAAFVQIDPWWTQDYAPKVQASKDYYETAGAR